MFTCSKSMIKSKQFKTNFDSSAIDLIKKLLTVDPKKRITLAEVVNHPWFKVCDEKGRELCKIALSFTEHVLATS